MVTEVYFSCDWGDDREFANDLKNQTPDCRGKWGSIRATLEPSEADFHVAFSQPQDVVSNDKLILFCPEPPANNRCNWKGTPALKKHPLTDFYKPQRWWVDQTYDDLKSMDPPDKNKNLSWITTDKGKCNFLYRSFRKFLMRRGFRKHQYKNLPFLNHPYDGHILRMEFLTKLSGVNIDDFHLYGKGDFNLASYKGEIEDKWNGLYDYRYSLAIENYKGPNYFSEKITDALLAWCMPIYWGCTNLDEYLPENSFVEIDIEGPNAPQRVKEIVESDLYEENLDAIAEARQLLLDKYQIWPTTERVVANHT